MQNKQLQLLVEQTSEILGLDEWVIEKDYYVTQVIKTLADVEDDHFQLIFAGGTCLAKAHKVVMRMSEDVDFKIQTKNAAAVFSKTKRRSALKKFREHITSTLQKATLICGIPIVRNEGTYFKYEIVYESAYSTNGGLRPHILLEFTLSNIQLAPSKLPVRTLITEALAHTADQPQATVTCISIAETAIEKWVALTRRTISIERGYESDDSTLIRHVYDLAAIMRKIKLDDEHFELAKTVICGDAQKFKNQHTEYHDDPSLEIRHSLSLLSEKSQWQDRYETFLNEMVYEQESPIIYEDALERLAALSAGVLATTSQQWKQNHISDRRRVGEQHH